MSEEEKPTTPAAEPPKEEESTAEFAPVVSLKDWMSVGLGDIEKVSSRWNSVQWYWLSMPLPLQ